jgi:NAD(P)-dependent dehydrogenase (short-subunit alcohol dehydrogenase family)
MPTALVTGASRGVGRGVAVALNKAGFRVYGTGRSIAEADLPDGICRIVCDHQNDDQTAAVFSRIADEGDALDVLVNNAWDGYSRMVEDGQFTWPAPFWTQPLHRWTSMIDAGVRTAFVSSAHAARVMIPKGRGLIVNISFWAAQKYMGNVIYGMAKAATDKMTSDMARELNPLGVSVLSLYPGLVRTEAVLAAAKQGWLDLSNSESPEFIGRVIAALAVEPKLSDRSGKVVIAAQAALELGVTDVDGRQPVPLTVDLV